MLHASSIFAPAAVALLASGCLLVPWQVRAARTGTVVDGQSSAPVPNAKVIVETWGADGSGRSFERSLLYSVEATTDERGRWSVGSEHDWTWILVGPHGAPLFKDSGCVFADGYETAAINPWRSEGQPPASHEVRETEIPEPITLQRGQRRELGANGLQSRCGVGVAAAAYAPPPPPPLTADNQAREEAYQRYRLTYTGGPSEPAVWKRADGVQQSAVVDSMASFLPETAEARARLHRRDMILMSLTLPAVDVVGVTLGFNVLAKPEHRWSTREQLVGYGIGAGFLLAAVVAAGLIPDPSPDLAAAYNRGLRRHLGLPPEASPTTRPACGIVALAGVGCAF